MPHLGGTPARPRQPIVLAITRAAFSLERSDVEGAPVGLLLLHPLWALPRVADRPHTAIKLTGNIFDQWLVILNFDVLGELRAKLEFASQFVHDGVIRQ